MSKKISLLAKKGLAPDNEKSNRYAELRKKFLTESGGASERPEPPTPPAAGASKAERDDYAVKYRRYVVQNLQHTRMKDEAHMDYEVVFDVTPEVSESGSAAYAEISDIRGPASILWYQGSPSRTFNISAKLISRNIEEAALNIRHIHVLKSWRMPESVMGGPALDPPTLLFLRGYGAMFKDIPVVMTDLSFELSSEHDYISDPTLSQDVPIILPVTISLKEAHSLEGNGIDNGAGEPEYGLGSFNILDYRNGTLKSW